VSRIPAFSPPQKVRYTTDFLISIFMNHPVSVGYQMSSFIPNNAHLLQQSSGTVFKEDLVRSEVEKFRQLPKLSPGTNFVTLLQRIGSTLKFEEYFQYITRYRR
jgi:hypothetical protein